MNNDLSFYVTVKAPQKRHTVIKFAYSCWGEMVKDTINYVMFKFDSKEGLDAFVDGLKTIK